MNNLQTAMLGNAIFSSLSAIGFILLRSSIVTSSGIPEIVLTVIAGGLLGFAALLLYGVFGPMLERVGKLAVWLDWLWVAGSIPALFFSISATGRFGIIVIAVLVAGFALWQQRGLKARGH